MSEELMEEPGGLEDEELLAADLAVENAREAAPPPKPRGRPRGPNPRPPTNVTTAGVPGVPMELSLDGYIIERGFDMPGYIHHLERQAPMVWNGMPTGGTLEVRETAFTLDEVQKRWGGGKYMYRIMGPKKDAAGVIIDNRPRPCGRKTFSIAGEPSLENLPTDGGQLVQGQQQQRGNDAVAPQAQAALVGVIEKQMDRLYDERSGGGRGDGSIDPDLFAQVRQSIETAAEAQVKAIRESAENEKAVLRMQLDEMRNATTELRAEVRAWEHKNEVQVGAARTEGNGLIGTLIPTFADNARAQVEQAWREANQVIARMQEQFARDVAAAESRFAQQLDNLKTMYAASELNNRTMYESRVHALEGEIQTLRQRAQHFETEGRGLRDQILALHMAQAEKRDLKTQLSELEAIRGLAEELGGGADSAPDPVSSVLTALAGVTQQVLASRQQPGAPQQQQPQQAAPAAQVPLLAEGITPQAPGPQQAPQRRPRPAGPPPNAVRRKDLEQGVALLNAAMASGTTPEKAADTAAQNFDRDLLRKLARKPAARILEALQASDLLSGPIASADGAAYLEAFLAATRERIGPPPSAPAGGGA